MGKLHRFRENLVLQGLLAQHPLKLTDALLQFSHLGCGHYRLIATYRFLSSLSHKLSPTK